MAQMENEGSGFAIFSYETQKGPCEVHAEWLEQWKSEEQGALTSFEVSGEVRRKGG